VKVRSFRKRTQKYLFHDRFVLLHCDIRNVNDYLDATI
jgi:hypothetical protein